MNRSARKGDVGAAYSRVKGFVLFSATEMCGLYTTG